MTDKLSGTKHIPVLGALLLALLIAGLAFVQFGSQDGGRSTTGNTAGQNALIEAQSAYLVALEALRTNPQAFAALEKASRRLESIDDNLVRRSQRPQFVQFKSSLKTVLGGRDDVIALMAARDDLNKLVPELSQRVYALEGQLTLQQQPLVAAHLERVRILSEVLRWNVSVLAAGAGNPAALAQQLVDWDMALTQIVRGFQQGDPELGLRAVTGSAALTALSAVQLSVSAISGKVNDVLAASDRLTGIYQAMQRMAALLPDLQPQPGSVKTKGDQDGIAVLTYLLAAGIVLLILMGWFYHRQAGLRRVAAEQAIQSERNQQAILRLLDELSSLADGDLTTTATVTEEITGAIADSINFAIEALRGLVTTVNDSAIMVDSATRQARATAQQLAEASTAQSRQSEVAGEAIGVMAASIEEVSGNAERSSDVARHSVDVAHKGGEAVRRTIEGMNTIRETIQETSKRIKRLGESSQEIGNIIELINDIADQTNILALNASIQASMAGEAGRGFAVVADEVQRLAERSANATKQIEVLVRTIQSDTNEAVVSMERSTTDVVGGALLAENAGAALEEIEQVSNQIATLVQNISSSTQEQATAAAAVTSSMDVLQEINSQTAASTSATTSAISELAELATELRRTVEGFRLPEVGSGDSAAEPEDDPAVDAGDMEDARHIEFPDQKTA